MRIPSLVVAAALTLTIQGVACSTSKPEAAKPATVADADEAAEQKHEEHEHAAAGDREKVDADGVVRRGTPLTASLEATPVSVVVAKAKDLDGKKVKLTGKVSDVCSKMGCWFVVQGDKPEDRIRISTKAHNIYVPHSAVGMKAVVEGTLSTRTLDQKTAEHLASESSDKKPAAGDVEIAIDVSGLEMSNS